MGRLATILTVTHYYMSAKPLGFCKLVRFVCTSVVVIFLTLPSAKVAIAGNQSFEEIELRKKEIREKLQDQRSRWEDKVSLLQKMLNSHGKGHPEIINSSIHIPGAASYQKVQLINNISTPKPTAPPVVQPNEASKNSGLTAAGIIGLTNQERIKNGTSKLAVNSLLNQAAAARVKDMVEHNYFSHSSPNGTDYIQAAKISGYKWSRLGENLAQGSAGYFTDIVAMEGWMKSAGHRKNILSNEFKEIGVAVGVGNYQGKKVWIAVQIFGTPG